MPRPSDRGRGYGAEALRLMLGYGFDALGLERIEARTLDVNARARRLLERTGFVREGGERAAAYLGGARCPGSSTAYCAPSGRRLNLSAQTVGKEKMLDKSHACGII